LGCFFSRARRFCSPPRPKKRQRALIFPLPLPLSLSNDNQKTKKQKQKTNKKTDLQMVNMTLRILSKPSEAKLANIFKSLGTDWEERVLPSIGNEVVKAVVAQYNAEQLLTNRDKVSAAVRAALTERADDFGIVLDDVAITHLSFGVEFTRAVEMKQVAEQDAERARFVVLKAEQERNAAVIRAEGESEAARLISDATRAAGPGLVELRRIEAARDIAETMARSPNVAYLPGGGSNMLLSINPGR
jgi:prohibitin 1